MKLTKLTILLLIFLFSAKSASAAITLRPALNLGLVGYWSMDEGTGTKAGDMSGNGNNGDITGASWTDGKRGKALSFNGTGDQITSFAVPPSASENFTYSAWVNIGATNSGYRSIYVANGGYQGLYLKDRVMDFYDNIHGGDHLGTATLATGGWHFITATHESTSDNLVLYINGAVDKTINDPGLATSAVTPFIGGHGSEYFNGLIDEVRIYNRALSPTEVASLYQTGAAKILAPNNTGLVGYWSFEEGTGTKAGDSSGNGKNGTITGATWTDGKRGKALSFNGTSAYIDAGNVYNGVKTISFWLKADATTGSIIDLNGTDKVEISSGTITTNIASPTIYVDGVVSSTVDTNWHYVTIKTDTGINASAATLGKVGASWACGDSITYCGDNYATVQMASGYGSQCWLQENLRNTTKPDCVTGITSYCHGSGCGSPWGRLYDWTTAMNGSTTATGCGAKIQGICPAGWHIPSYYTGCATDDFPALGTDGGALKKVNTSSGVPWTEPNTSATNASNWTGYPAGFWDSGFYSRGNYGYFWSSAGNGGSMAWARYLSYSNAGWYEDNDSKANGFSLRCVKDTSGGSASYFSGKLDEVRMYNRALSGTEIASLYQQSSKITTINASQNNQLTSGLVGLWSFNGPDVNMSTNTAYDRSGQNNNGTITGATPAIGKVGQALSFDGTDDTVSLSDMGTVESYPFTFSAWFKISSSDNRATIVSQDNSADEVQRVQLYYGGTGFCYNVRNGVSNEAEPCDNSMSVPDDQWHHAVGVSSASNDHKLYIDGTLLATSTNSVSAPAVDRATIGDWPEGTENNPEDYHATGLIDEVRIYNRALSAGEVQQLYNMSAVGFRCGDMLAYNGDNYTTVKMPATYGSQCWLGENLRTTKKPDGVTGITTYCNPSGCDSPWGRLYTWTTAMNGSTTATGCGAKIQGICPSGWHIPSDYTSCSGDDFPGLGSDSGPLKQAGTTNWTSPNTGATNASNLTVYPAGYWSSAFYYRGNYGIFWSSAEFNGANTFDRTLSYNDANFYRSYDSKGYGVSVRCVKD